MTTRLLLVCSAGMSTSLLVNRMKAAAKANDQDIVVEAVAAADAKQRLAAFGPDILLLGPQVKFMLPVFEQEAYMPVQVIDTTDFSNMDGEKILSSAMAALA